MSGTDWTTTPNLGLFKPVYDADVEQWGNHLNQNADTLDATLAQTGASAVFVALAGASMTGPLVLSQDPTAALGAASKQYVDTQLIALTGVVVADIAPSAPKQGMLWFDSVGGRLYLSYNDGNSTQWVAV